MEKDKEIEKPKEAVYITHISNVGKANKANKAKSYLVDVGCIKKSVVLFNHFNNADQKIQSKPFVINNGDDNALIFIVKYLNFYKDIDEIPPPEHPLLNIPLNELFDIEQHIFGDLLIISNIDKKINIIKNLVEISEELQLEILLDKLAAISCFYMQSL